MKLRLKALIMSYNRKIRMGLSVRDGLICGGLMCRKILYFRKPEKFFLSTLKSLRSWNYINFPHFRVHQGFWVQNLPNLQTKHFCSILFSWEQSTFDSVISTVTFFNRQGDKEEIKWEICCQKVMLRVTMLGGITS